MMRGIEAEACRGFLIEMAKLYASMARWRAYNLSFA